MDMDFTRKRAERDDSTWPGASFVIEALVLLVFLMAALAIFMQLFSGAAREAVQNRSLEHAIVLASNTAESFSAAPATAVPSSTDGDYTVTCEITPEKTAAGTLYHAKIDVSENGTDVYSLETSRYVSGGA